MYIYLHGVVKEKESDLEFSNWIFVHCGKNWVRSQNSKVVAPSVVVCISL